MTRRDPVSRISDIGDPSHEQAKELDERAAEVCDAGASESDGQSVGRRGGENAPSGRAQRDRSHRHAAAPRPPLAWLDAIRANIEDQYPRSRATEVALADLGYALASGQSTKTSSADQSLASPGWFIGPRRSGANAAATSLPPRTGAWAVYPPQNPIMSFCNADTSANPRAAAAPLSPPYCRASAETLWP